MSVIDDAITKLQAHALALTDTEINGAPDKPIESASVLPLAIAHISEGTSQADDVTANRMILTISVDIHVNRNIMKSAYTQINNIVPEYLNRLAGDPTLGGTVDNIVFPVTFAVSPAVWDAVTTQMISIKVPIKIRTTPTT